MLRQFRKIEQLVEVGDPKTTNNIFHKLKLLPTHFMYCPPPA